MNTKRIVGLAALCLICAVAASALTLWAMTRGLFGIYPPTPETGATPQTSPQDSTATPTPTKKPTPTPTKAPSVTSQPTISVPPTPTPKPNEATNGDPEPKDHPEDSMILSTERLIEKLYEEVSPSVVSIEVEVEEFGKSQFRTNQGSGLILRETGEIATNAAILSIATDKNGNLLANAIVRVKVKDIDRPFAAALIGHDVLSGLAVIKIDPADHKLKPGVFAQAPDVRIGQVVMAVGYPDILYESGGLSSGLITGINRTVLLEDGLAVQMLQTNAPVSLNCSGGPLLNLKGEVLGLTNCAVIREAIDSLSYVLPSAVVQTVSVELIDNGQTSGRSWLGVSVLSEASFLELQKLYGLPDGLYVSHVISDSPAYTADLRKNDIITRLNGIDVGTSLDISRFLQINPPGTLVEIRVYRRTDGRYYNLKTYLQEKIG
ncbi:MAG: S1C family serine protease [Saccharofermentanales bacterium]|nr:serine protease [Clostridiaceae bacterium]